MIDIVASEKFVCALTGQDNLDVLCCQFIYKIKCDTGRICQRLIHVIHNLWNAVKILIRTDGLIDVLFAEFCRQALCVTDLVVLALFIQKSNGIGLFSRELSHQIRGIHTTGKRSADLYVCNHMRHSRLVYDLLDLVYCLFQRLRFFCRLHERIVILMDLDLTVLHEHIMSCRQLKDPLEEGLRQYGILERHILL